jgi:hypothetical protein
LQLGWKRGRGWIQNRERHAEPGRLFDFVECTLNRAYGVEIFQPFRVPALRALGKVAPGITGSPVEIGDD